MARKKTPSLAVKSLPNLTQLGSIGLDTSSGLVFDSTIRELRGFQAPLHFREMADHSAVIGACLFAFEMLLRKVRWRFEPGDESAEEANRAELLQGMIEDMSHSWEDCIAEMLSMLVYGYSTMEMVYKIRRGPDDPDVRYNSRFKDGIIGWRKWLLIPQETILKWIWNDDGEVVAFVQRAPMDGIERVIPSEKSLLFRTKVSRNNPQGRSLLVNAWFPWKFAKRIMELEGVGVERDLAGLPMALLPMEYLDPNASQDDKDFLSSVKDLVTSVRRNSQDGIVFPMAFDDQNNPLFEFKLLATGGMRQFDTGKIIERHERRMAMSLLSDFILMGHERVGSLALSRDKTTLIGRALAGILASIAAVINRQAIPRLYKLNGWDPSAPCKICPGDVENADIKNLGLYVNNLMSVGAMTPDPGLEAALREAGGLPKIDPAYILGPGEVPAVAGGGQQDQTDNQDQNDVQKSDDDDEDDFDDELPITKVTQSPGSSFTQIMDAAQKRRTRTTKTRTKKKAA